ncbi:alpha-2Da adrenergic receptor-like [Mercenaria mercenaria]|uniref:alpha-2Da adrenergic receptor-like n=1 Tax=Mercenaria mercenaria TaxID=6596 RepID=UPI00234F3F51|nr:alpha-2Da adrenergic receptor-like [Mercenaria mercenaria]XP_053383260.1 alpha-2Da adrenergic receptor-like [Mercenaria mercenaria]XP_053383261.1 alpha-2Da adrenergic receptor-like [Mercenaria mercenaria]
MENITMDKEQLLERLNNDKAVLMTPVMVILGIFMIMGLIGNAMVCFFYTCKSRQSSNTIFIVAMAVYDLILCCLSIPIEIVDLRFFYLFTNSGACKFMRFVNYFGAVGSVYTLLVIAVDRYRKICRPFKKQLKLREAKIACGISVIVSIVFSWPALVFYRSVSVDVLTEEGILLKGCDCTTTRDDSYKVYLWVFNGVYLICFLISSIVLCVMYSLVGRVLFKHNKSRKRYGSRPISSNSNSSGTENHLTEFEQPKSNEKHKYTVNESVESEADAANRRSVINMVAATDLSTTGKSQNQLDIKTVKYTTMMLVITLVFILSFLPHLILSLWRNIQGQYEGETLSDAELIAFQIGIRSYFLNSAINPLTYGFFNPKFRQFFYMTFCPCCRRPSESNTISTSSGPT